ncbi:Caffeine synthase 1 [Acorus calamus]|uniref:Caffeine synthase 1 n=1 Tax=Acorus calamus TaxID=4465 RepID=A0AAV9FCG8_ACOCL|nr:Caffeine synthase 1 [Acorus calamus]
MIQNGRMVLILHGREAADPTCKGSCYVWELLAEALSYMVSQGCIKEEKLDTFNVPYYTPTLDEVAEAVEEEGSFEAKLLETFSISQGDEVEEDVQVRGSKIAKNIRCFTEPLIAHHLGEDVLEKLFEKVTHMVIDQLAKEMVVTTGILLVLKMKN